MELASRLKDRAVEITEKFMELSIRFTARRALISIGTILVLGLFLSFGSVVPPSFDIGPISPILLERRATVEDAFQHAWNGYAKDCLGHDTLHPVTNTCGDDLGGWGASAIDALSTAILMRKDMVVFQILAFIAELDFDVVRGGTKVQAFEIIIRNLGGMISAWDLLNGPFSDMGKGSELRDSLYTKMVDLADRMGDAFDTPSGIPHDWVDPRERQGAPGTMNTVAGAGTVILEFARLSDITGNQTYARLAERAENYLLKPQPEDYEPFPGLIGSYVSVDSGELQNSRGSWGAFSDSFYEYLLKAYIYNSNVYREYLDRWLLAADSTMRFVGSHPFGHPEWTLLPSWDGTHLNNRMESLSWFAGGNFILGGMVTNNQTLIDYGLWIADTAGAVYNMTATGLGGEFVTWATICDEDDCDPKNALQISDTRFKLRPEAIEAWYYAYRATRNTKYQDWAWAAFEAINRYCRTDTGFSAILNVDAEDGGGRSDVQESFVFAEVLKYIYLIHLEDREAPFHVQDSRTGVKNTWVFNTEAHPLRVAGPAT